MYSGKIWGELLAILVKEIFLFAKTVSSNYSYEYQELEISDVLSWPLANLPTYQPTMSHFWPIMLNLPTYLPKNRTSLMDVPLHFAPSQASSSQSSNKDNFQLYCQARKFSFFAQQFIHVCFIIWNLVDLSHL